MPPGFETFPDGLLFPEGFETFPEGLPLPEGCVTLPDGFLLSAGLLVGLVTLFEGFDGFLSAGLMSAFGLLSGREADADVCEEDVDGRDEDADERVDDEEGLDAEVDGREGLDDCEPPRDWASDSNWNASNANPISIAAKFFEYNLIIVKV